MLHLKHSSCRTKMSGPAENRIRSLIVFLIWIHDDIVALRSSGQQRFRRAIYIKKSYSISLFIKNITSAVFSPLVIWIFYPP